MQPNELKKKKKINKRIYILNILNDFVDITSIITLNSAILRLLPKPSANFSVPENTPITKTGSFVKRPASYNIL